MPVKRIGTFSYVGLLRRQSGQHWSEGRVYVTIADGLASCRLFAMDLYSHVRVLFSILLGLGVSHLLRGLARIVQHPKEYKVYWVHLVWSLFLFLYLIHFWWWEFRLRQVTEWTFPRYFFVALYATLMYMLCTLLFPDEMADYKGFQEYFYSRKGWIFSFMTLLFVADIGDTLLKGLPYFESIGPLYFLRIGSWIVLSLIAIKVNNRTYQAAFAVFALLTEVLFILTAQRTMG
ncbi:MAG: hypothetical protein WBS19_06205 [Candidatus Korobacteraceae bacterium]